MAEVEFMALLRGIGVAIKEAQKALETYGVAQYAAYFDEQDEEGDKVLHPKTVSIALPQAGDAKKIVKVPLVSITNHHNLMLEEVKVRLRVSTHVDDKSGTMRVDVGGGKKKKGDSENVDQVLQEIRLTFKRDNPPEGVARLTQEATKLL